MAPKPTFAFEFRVTVEGHDPREVTAGPGELIKLERQYGIGAAAMANPTTQRFEHLAYLAWRALRRHTEGIAAGDFNDFLEQLVDLEVLSDDDDTPAEPITCPECHATFVPAGAEGKAVPTDPGKAVAAPLGS